MRKDVNQYFRSLGEIINKITATDINGKTYQFDKAIGICVQMIIKKASCGQKILFIGNGASAAIASHIATDFWKNVGIRALAFNDSSLLTCISNDYGYKYVFEKPIEMFADDDDILCAISSSGESENILRAAKTARKKSLKIITFSGFYKDNQLRKLGDINFFVPIHHYGFVETIHTALCHCLVDMTKKFFVKRC